MHIHYHPNRNLIMEVLLAPEMTIGGNSLLETHPFTTKQQELIQDIIESARRLATASKPFIEAYDECMLSTKHKSLAISCYLHLLSLGYEPTTPEEVFDLFLQMSTEDIRLAMKKCLTMDDDDFLTAIKSKDDLGPKERWYWLTATQEPKVYMQKVVALLRQFTPIYLKERALYQEEYEKALSTMQQYSLDYLLNHVIEVDKESKQFLLEQDGVLDTYIFSPPYLLFMLLLRSDHDVEPNLLFISPRIEALMSQSTTATNDNVKDILKLLSDPTSYQVLTLLTSTTMKAKDIAKQLGITGAAVSYHTQKLVLQKLLVFSADENEAKYILNKALIKEVFQQLTIDLALE